MIDLHTHSLLSDGDLLPCELARRAEAKEYEAIAITDHADISNIDFVIPRIVKACDSMNKYWKIKVIPGVEITHVPLQTINRLVKFARKKGARIVVGHGETISEPVLPGTNRAFIKAGVDILGHPGMIDEKDIELAVRNDVCLELTTRKSHKKPNRRLVKLALKHNASLVLNTDTHSPEDLLDDSKRLKFLYSIGLSARLIETVNANSRQLIK